MRDDLLDQVGAEPAPLRLADGGIDFDAIRDAIASNLHLIPRYRQKLQWIPFVQHPVWVDDERFNLDFHVRHTALPHPGTDEQLKRLSARIMQQHLDRRRPLWEMWIVEGLERDRFALVSKVHHCMIDGMSGVDIMRVLMWMSPEYEIHEAPTYIPRPAPSSVELLQHEILRWASLPLTVARGLGTVVGEARNLRRDALTRVRAAAATLGASLSPPSSTPLNGEVGPHRRFDWLTMDLSEIKQIRRTLGGSLNDVVLTIVNGAVRRFMKRRQVRLEDLDFRVMAPVSVRSEEEQGALGNRVSAWLIDLPVAEADPRRQLAAINEATDALKRSKNAVGAELLSQAAEWTPSMLLSLGARNASRLLPFNLVVTNVPGPQIPMYLLGAKMEECFPHVPLTDNLGLGIALMSYDGKLCWGFNADYDLVPDLAAFIGGIREAYEELRGLAAQVDAAARARGGASRIEAPVVEAAASDQAAANGPPTESPGLNGGTTVTH